MANMNLAAKLGKYKLRGNRGLTFTALGATNTDEASNVEFPLLSFSGTAATRAAVRAELGDFPAIGCLYIGQSATATTRPNLYVKIAASGGDTDWERIVSQAAD